MGDPMSIKTETRASAGDGAAEPPEPRPGRRLGAIAAGIAFIALAGGGMQVLHESENNRTTALITYELRLSGDAVGPALQGGDRDEGRLTVELFAGARSLAGAEAPRWSRDEGDRMIVSGRFRLTKAGKPDAIVVSRARISNYRFGLDLPANPAPTHGFDGWRRADVAFDPEGHPISSGLDQYELRLRIERKGR